jgi:hypothetical protein
MTSLPELEAQRCKVQETFSKADAALHTGMITQEERDALLSHYYGTGTEQYVLSQLDSQIEKLRGDQDPPDHRTPALIIGFMLFMTAMFATLFLSTGGITGAVVFEENTTLPMITETTVMELNLANVTTVLVSGTATGIGNAIITLETGGESHTLYEYRRGSAETTHAGMERTWYTEGEDVTYSTTADSTYLMTEQATLLDNTTITGLAAGKYTLKFLVNDTEIVLEETIGFIVASPGSLPDETFDSCGEACNTFLDGPAILRITIEDDATLQDAKMSLRMKTNSPPRLAKTIPDASGEDSVTMDMSAYFTDEDGDALFYDSTRHDGMTESWNGSILNVSGPVGTYTYIVYASDLADLTPSNIFSVTITTTEITEPVENTPEPSDEMSGNGTQIPINETNTTPEIPATSAPETNGTDTLDCSAPNPNDRPLDCLNINATRFFEEDIFLEDIDRQQVARITPIGNLLITGRVYKQSTAVPGQRDFNIGHSEDFQQITTIWIDSGGNLHLRGTLHEENANIVPPSGSYAVINRRGVYMAYANPQTGDLYLRGNVIPFRESIYE